MKISDLVFIGIKGSVVALNRATGEQVWVTHLTGSDFVNVLLDSGQILATCRGEIFCLDPLSGVKVWHNRLKGLGMGLVTIATEDAVRSTVMAVFAEKQRLDQQAAATASVAAV